MWVLVEVAAPSSMRLVYFSLARCGRRFQVIFFFSLFTVDSAKIALVPFSVPSFWCILTGLQIEDDNYLLFPTFFRFVSLPVSLLDTHPLWGSMGSSMRASSCSRVAGNAGKLGFAQCDACTCPLYIRSRARSCTCNCSACVSVVSLDVCMFLLADVLSGASGLNTCD